MKKFGLRIFSLVIALVVAVVLTGCVIQQGTKIEFSQLPAGVYTTETGSINLDDVTIKVNNKELTLAAAKDEYNVTITGDSWTTYGEYTLVVILDGAAITFKYYVKESIAQVTYDTAWEGEGTSVSPWLIQNEEELKGLAAVVNKKAVVAGLDPNCAGKYFKVTNDIELTPGWEPIGAGYRKGNNLNYFAGNFDGNNKVISGLTNVGYNPVEVAGDYQNSSGELVAKGYVYGLFGTISNATIKNVKMSNVYIEDITLVIDKQVVKFETDSAGAIAGYVPSLERNGVASFDTNKTVVENCHVLNGDITGYDATAGIIGRVYSHLTITNCSNAANISAYRDGGAKCGGIVGTLSQTSNKNDFVVINCSNSGKILAERSSLVGGIIGTVAACTTFEEKGNTNTGRVFGAEQGKLVEYYVLGDFGGNLNDPKFKIENPENWK